MRRPSTLRLLPVVLTAIVTTGCGGSAPRSTPVHSPEVTPSGSTSSTTPAAPVALNLRTSDWRNLTVPGAACLQRHALQLRNGRVRIRDARGNPDSRGQAPYFNLAAALNAIVYGDLEGGGASDAAVPLTCDNNSGTADGQLLFSLALFSGTGGHRHLLGLVTPREQSQRVHVTIIGTFDKAVAISPNVLVVREVFYGANDPTCCPSGRATTTWSYGSGRLKAESTRVTQPAN